MPGGAVKTKLPPSLTVAHIVPDVLPRKTTPFVGDPLQTTWFGIAFTVGVGLTVIVKVRCVPVHVVPPFVYVGVTVIVAVTGALVALVAVKLAISPVPEAANPIDGALLAQL